MSRSNAPGVAMVEATQKADEPDEQQKKNEARADAASRLNVDPARLGAELAAEDRSSDATETAAAIKRAAKSNDPA